MDNLIIPFGRLDLYLKRQIVTHEGEIFEIEGEILGKGGNGFVYKCTNSSTGIDYAVKFLTSNAEKRITRFEREINFLKECNSHNSIITYIGSGSAEGQLYTKGRNRRARNKATVYYYLMELADGGSLKDLISTNGAMSFVEYSGQLRGLADALSYLHSFDVLHRDIKPENILISGERWLLSDFGLITPLGEESDLSGDSEKIGPVFWMSPEATNRCLGINGDEAEICKLSDVFQLASVFWYVVNKKHPTGILDQDDWKGKEQLYQVLHRALQHDKSKRHLSGKEFYEDIVSVIES